MSINVQVDFDPTVPVENNHIISTWWICISSGEWDTYREQVFTSPTKPTARQLRQAIKGFKA